MITVPGLLLIDLTFWGANVTKLPHGGWPSLRSRTFYRIPPNRAVELGVQIDF